MADPIREATQFIQNLVPAIAGLLGGMSHSPVKKAVIKDGATATARSAGGASIMMTVETTIEVEGDSAAATEIEKVKANLAKEKMRLEEEARRQLPPTPKP